MGNALSQSFFIPAPTLTEKNLPDQSGRVFIVTGGYAGCGYELSKILYSANGSVYVFGRSKDKADAAIAKIRAAHPDSRGKIEFMHGDLADLSTLKPAVDAFKAKESRLDVLTNNAGVMIPPSGSKSAQGYELQIATNCLGPYLLTKELMPLLQKTAAESPAGTVRVTWAGSLGVDGSPKGGYTPDENGAAKELSMRFSNYAQSKAGNVLLAGEGARRQGKDGIMHLAWNPGNLSTELQRHTPLWQLVFIKPILYPAIYGAYTELGAGWSDNITMEQNGGYVVPWGRTGSYRSDIMASMKSKEEGGSGKAAQFWNWCDEATKQYSSG